MRRFPRFTPDEFRAYRVLHDLGDAARWGLHWRERLAAWEVRQAHRRALALARAIPPHESETLK